jgi:hypothetical protein
VNVRGDHELHVTWRHTAGRSISAVAKAREVKMVDCRVRANEESLSPDSRLEVNVDRRAATGKHARRNDVGIVTAKLDLEGNPSDGSPTKVRRDQVTKNHRESSKAERARVGVRVITGRVELKGYTLLISENGTAVSGIVIREWEAATDMVLRRKVPCLVEFPSEAVLLLQSLKLAEGDEERRQVVAEGRICRA